MPTAADLLPLLQRHWGFDRFRPLQAEALQAVLDGRDSVVVLPTGGGKSLCYQLPALVRDGLAVVVSPLISLMKDQVDALAANGVPAASVNSTHSLDERRLVADEIRTGRLRLLYISPERLCMEKTLDFLGSIPLTFFAIDEAHCISQWGHDFRPEYRMLSVLKERYPGVSVHAFTATATEQVRRDIATQLRLSEPEFHIGSFDRPNLMYRVEPRRDVYRQIQDVLGRHKGESGIIYCISRRETEDVSSELNALGHRTRPYHAGLADALRQQTQNAFQKEDIDIVVATVAFGMGIDKSNVRFVIHTGSPKSLEHYQQESGRAGRDGLEAECCLIYSGRDFKWWREVVEKLPPEASGVARATLRHMEGYCQGVTCRHRALVEYFNQAFERDNCGACDVCLMDLDLTPDAKIVAQKILSCVVRLKESFGAQYTAQVLCGSEEQRIRVNGHHELSTYGLLKETGTQAVRMWIDQLAAQGYIERHGEYQQLRVTPAGWTVLKGNATPRLLQPPKRKERRERKAARVAAASADLWEGVDRGLFEELRKLRRRRAEEMGVPPFVVFGDQTLRDLARRRPASLRTFRQVHGIGDKKCADYGELFTAAIRNWCTANALETDVEPGQAALVNTEVRLTPSRARRNAFTLFEEGRPIDEVAQRVERAVSTATQYLVEFIAHTGRIEPSPWIDERTAARIEQAIEAAAVKAEIEGIAGGTKLAVVFEELGGRIPYDQIRIVAACRQNRPSN